MKVLSFVMILVTAVSGVFGQNGESKYKITNRFPVEGDGSWDYLTIDEGSNHLFISHGTVVQVLDVKSGKLLATIPDTKGVHGIALVNNLNKGFISNGRDSSVTVFDLKTLKTLGKISISGKNPDAIIYDPFSQHIFTFNGRSSNATVIDPQTDKEIGTIAFEGKPEEAVSDGKGKIFVNIEDKSKISVIDVKTQKVVQSWLIKPGEEPSGLAFDPESQRLFTVCGNKVMVIIDAQSGKMINALPIGDRVDGAAFDLTKKRAYSSNGDGTLTVIQEGNATQFKVLENVKTMPGARTISLNSKTHKLYLPTAEFGPAPAPTKENPRPRPTIKPGSFVILEVSPVD